MLFATVLYFILFIAIFTLALSEGPNSPTAGSNSGSWTNPDGAISDAGGEATTTAKDIGHIWWGFGFNIPSGNTIDGIEVTCDAWTGNKGPDNVDIDLSWDGSSWTDAKTQIWPLSETAVTSGNSSDTWGRAWSTTEINSDNFRVRVTSRSVPAAADSWNLDWIRIIVYYTEVDNPPTWSNNQSSIVSTYNPSTPSYFNITWQDDNSISTAWFESNYSSNPNNYSMNEIATDVYNYSAILPAGSYYWKSYANDSAGQWNNSDSWIFTIAKATPSCTLSVSLSPVSYGIETMANCSCTNPEASAKLWRNESDVTSENGTLVTLPAGNWYYICNSSSTQNYSSATDDDWINITKAATTVNLTLNGNEDNVTVIYPDTITAIYWTDNVSATMYRNQSDVSNENGTAITLATGYYNYTVINYGNENYSASSKTFFVTVQQNTSSCDVLFNESSPVDYGTTFRVWSNCTSAFTLYRNGTTISNNSEQNLAAGTYNFSVIRTDNENYSNTYDEQTFTVNQTSSEVATFLNNSRANATITTENSIWLNASTITGDPEATLRLYNNGTLINEGTSPRSNLTTFNIVGLYNITGVYLESQNYTSSSETWWVNVTAVPDTTPPEVNLISPENYQNLTSSVEFNCSMTDDEDGLKNSTLYGNWSGGWHVNETKNITGASNSTTFSKTILEGTYIWNCYVCDQASPSNCAFNSTNWTFTVDTTGPTLSNENANETEITLNSYFCLNVTATDPTGVSSVLAEVWNTTGFVNYTMSDTGSTSCDGESGDTVYGIEIQGTAQGIWNYSKVHANDILNNWATYDFADKTINVTAPADSPPSVTLNSPIDFYNSSSTSIIFNCTAYDDINLVNVSLYGNWIGWHLNETNSSPVNDMPVTFNKTINNGTYVWNCKACDNASQCSFASANRTFTIDTIGPSLTVQFPLNNSYLSVVQINITGTAFDINKDSIVINDTRFGANQGTYENWNFTNSSLAEETYVIKITANDSAGNENSSVLVFTIDVTQPVASLGANPIDEYNTTSQSITFDLKCVDENPNTLQLWGNWTGTWHANQTNSSPINDTYWNISVSIPEGTHKWAVYCNDSAGNSDWSDVNRTFTIDLTAPQWTGNQSSTPSFYSPTTKSIFNITWTDALTSVDTVFIEGNWSGSPQNYSMTDLGSGSYGYEEILPAGTHYWKSYSNDTLNNMNVSDTWSFTINKAVTDVKLYLNGSQDNLTVTYPTATNATATLNISTLTFTLYRNGTQIDSGTSPLSEVITLGASYYNYTASYDGNQNYTSDSETFFLTVNKGTSEIALYLDGTRGNRNYQNNTYANFTVKLITPSSGNVELWTNYSDGVTKQWDSGASPLENITLLDVTGTFWWKGNWSGNENYSSNEEQWITTITTDIAPTVTLNSPIDFYNSSSTSIIFNCTAYDDINLVNVSLYGNWIGWHLNETNSSPVNDMPVTFNKTINNGTYVWNCKACDNASQCSFASANRTFTIDTIGPVISHDSPQNNTYFNYAPYLNGTCTDAGVGISSIWTNLTEYPTIDTTSPYNFTNTSSLTEQLYDVKISCNDSLGNTAYEIFYFIFDITNPFVNVTLPTLSSGNYSQNYIESNISVSETNFQNVSHYLYYTNNGSLKESVTYTALNETYSIYNFTFLDDGNYTLNHSVYDKAGNLNSTTSRTYNLDTTAPTYTNDSDDSDGSVAEGAIITVSVYWQDAVRLDTGIFRNNKSGSWENVSTCSLSGASDWCNKTINTTNDAGKTICWNQYANDSLGHLNNSMSETIHCFSVTTNNPPNVSLVSPQDEEVIEVNYVNFTCNATDDLQLANITFYWNYSGSWEKNGTNIVTGMENETNFFRENLDNGAILWGCLAYDTIGNSNWSKNRSIVIKYIPAPPIPPPRGGGGGRRMYEYECTKDSDCNETYFCWNYKCVKLFDLKIIRVDSPIPPGEFLDFTYIVKEMSNVNGDVVIDFWLEKDNVTVTSGSDTIYLGGFEKKIETTSIFLPSSIEKGTYKFYIQIDFQGHKTTSHRVVEVKYPHEVPLILDINLIKLPTVISKNFSFILAINRDLSVLVKLNEKLKKGEQLIWSKERELEVTRSIIIEEDVGELRTGNYQLDLTAYYENKTARLVQNFSISKKINYLPFIFSFLIIVVLIFLILYWKKIWKELKKLKEILHVKREILEKEEAEEKKYKEEEYKNIEYEKIKEMEEAKEEIAEEDKTERTEKKEEQEETTEKEPKQTEEQDKKEKESEEKLQEKAENIKTEKIEEKQEEPEETKEETEKTLEKEEQEETTEKETKEQIEEPAEKEVKEEEKQTKEKSQETEVKEEKTEEEKTKEELASEKTG